MPGDKCEDQGTTKQVLLTFIRAQYEQRESLWERNTTRNGLLPPKIDQEHLGDNWLPLPRLDASNIVRFEWSYILLNNPEA